MRVAGSARSPCLRSFSTMKTIMQIFHLLCLVMLEFSAAAHAWSPLKALEEIGKLGNTVVNFTSDNGYFCGGYSLGDKGGDCGNPEESD
jgi:hypothetical protein